MTSPFRRARRKDPERLARMERGLRRIADIVEDVRRRQAEADAAKERAAEAKGEGEN